MHTLTCTKEECCRSALLVQAVTDEHECKILKVTELTHGLLTWPSQMLEPEATPLSGPAMLAPSRLSTAPGC